MTPGWWWLLGGGPAGGLSGALCPPPEITPFQSPHLRHVRFRIHHPVPVTVCWYRERQTVADSMRHAVPTSPVCRCQELGAFGRAWLQTSRCLSCRWTMHAHQPRPVVRLACHAAPAGWRARRHGQAGRFPIVDSWICRRGGWLGFGRRLRVAAMGVRVRRRGGAWLVVQGGGPSEAYVERTDRKNLEKRSARVPGANG